MIKPKFMLVLCLLMPFMVISQVEICDNGIDDDNDQLIDLNDEDCPCEIVVPVSLIPNPSFEEQNCCPSDRSQLDCAVDWIQASEPTTDYIHACDWLGWDDFPPPQPFPDGDGIMGFRDGRIRGSTNQHDPYWKEYAGACLTGPLQKDSSYRFQFDVGFVDPRKSPGIDISFFGTTNCENLPFGVGDPEFGCPTNSSDWIKLGEVRVSGGVGNRWINTFLEVIPDEDIYAIAIGPDCTPVRSEVSLYYFFDNLLLANFESFDMQISEVQHPCSPDYTLSVANNPEFSYQWFKFGIALQGEVFSELTQNYGAGSYQVRIIDGTSCRVSAKFEYVIPIINSTVSKAICQGDIFNFGDVELTLPGFYVDTFQSENLCDSIVSLELAVIGAQYDTLEVTILEGESYELDGQRFVEAGDYALTFTSSLNCDSLVLLKLTNFNVYFPNAFSPNNDGINDIFYPLSSNGVIESIHMQIFDRWGSRIFEGSEWDGSDQQSGVFIYLINVDFVNGKSKMFYGSISLLL